MEPQYREANPKLDLREVRKAFFDDRRVCWFQGLNYFRGEVLILGTPENILEIHYLFFGRGYTRCEGDQCFTLDYAPTRLNPERCFFRCPSCDERKMTLWFKTRWACGECHGFRYRTQALPGAQRIYERNLRRHSKLHARVAAGRPHRVRNTTYERQSEELAELAIWLQENPLKSGSVRQQSIVTHEWHRASELADQLWSNGYTRQGDVIEPSPW